jgi:hypothetical protein
MLRVTFARETPDHFPDTGYHQVAGCKWGAVNRTLQTKSFHSAVGTLNWAAVGAATASEADDFAVDGRKGEADKCGRVEIRVGVGEHLEAVITHAELTSSRRNG